MCLLVVGSDVTRARFVGRDGPESGKSDCLFGIVDVYKKGIKKKYAGCGALYATCARQDDGTKQVATVRDASL